MSFSGDVKRELAGVAGKARHCQVAELAAIITMCGGVSVSAADRAGLRIHTENRSVAQKVETLLRIAFGCCPQAGVRRYARSSLYLVALTDHEQTMEVLRGCHLIPNAGGISALMDIGEELPLMENPMLRRSCCQRAYLRGAFLSAGSISDPKKFYHFEIVCASTQKARQLQEIGASFGLDARIIQRKGSDVLYLKEGTQIVDALGIMEAVKSLMELENIRILREISNGINRRVNCEAANISKAVAAGVRQSEDIRYIQGHGGLEQLPEGLAELAKLRMEYLDSSLEELGRMLHPPLGKSGVNHRFQKIAAFAQTLRDRHPNGLRQSINLRL